MERQAQQRQVVAVNYSTIWLIVLSVVVHLIFLALLNRPFETIQTDREHSAPVVKARLYFPPPPKPAPVPQPEPVKALPEKPDESIADQVPKNTEKTQPQADETVSEQPIIEDNVVSGKNIARNVDKPSTEPAEQQSSTQIEKAYRHIGQHNQSKVQQMAAEAAAEFRRRQNSPAIAPTATPELSADEQLIESIQKKANCDGVARKTTAILTGLLGANIKCTATPDFQPYIQQHLDKVGAGEKQN
ncbi:hypothetical protein [Neptunicella sp. SCSIO 80796]|uniref:hypothetical protein n=1 Tax=Neptunicella plasticusilytica TaxID=3117012 RepID=UPI003A4DEAB8